MNMNDDMKASFECGFPFLSMYNRFLEYCEIKDISVESLLDDELHPNDKGHKVIYKLILGEFRLGRKVL